MDGIMSRRVSPLICAAVLMVGMSTFLDVTLASQWVVGGSVQKWNFLHASNVLTWYDTVWAANLTFKTGDSLVFEYDNTTHSVSQLATVTDYNSCNLNAVINKWQTGNDSIFISNNGTFYYVCGVPSHCGQGMKVSITATGSPKTAPVGTSTPSIVFSPAPSPSQAPLATLFPGTLLILLVAALATHGVVVWL